jgi:hypothetical protein
MRKSKPRIVLGWAEYIFDGSRQDDVNADGMHHIALQCTAPCTALHCTALHSTESTVQEYSTVQGEVGPMCTGYR